MILRIADFNDINELVNMRFAYLESDFGLLSEEHRKKLKIELPDYFSRHLNQDLYAYVAEDQGRLVAAVFMILTERPANPNFITGKVGTMMNVYTLELYRKQGIATKLLKMGIEEAKEQGAALIELNATEQGFPLYKELGFEINESTHTSMKLRLVR